MNRNRFKNHEEIKLIELNAIDIAEKIKYYLDKPDELKSIGQAGAKKIKELYSLDNQVGRRIEIIKNELNKL